MSITVQQQILEYINGTYNLKNYAVLRELNLTDQDIQFLLVNLTKYMRTEKSFASETNTCYCHGTMRNIAIAYRNIHGYVSLFVCIFGTLANIINIVILTRKHMKTASFSYILMWLAVADMLLMIEYIPFVLYMYTDSKLKMSLFSYAGAIYILIHTHLSQVLHTISICLTLTLAFWRYNAVRYPEKCNTLWTKKKCSTVVKFAMLLPTIICIPSYFMFSIQSTTLYEKGENYHFYYLDLSELAKSNNEFFYITNLWLYAVVIKLLPCIILIIISIALIKALHNATKRKQKLHTFTAAFGKNNNIKLQKTRRRADRSSHMLIAILFLFLITELPQCILGILSGILGTCFFKNCYHLFGEVMDILALLNGAINFILYCTMSKQFRSAFVKLFKYIRVFREKSNAYEFHT